MGLSILTPGTYSKDRLLAQASQVGIVPVAEPGHHRRFLVAENISARWTFVLSKMHSGVDVKGVTHQYLV